MIAPTSTGATGPVLGVILSIVACLDVISVLTLAISFSNLTRSRLRSSSLAGFLSLLSLEIVGGAAGLTGACFVCVVPASSSSSSVSSSSSSSSLSVCIVGVPGTGETPVGGETPAGGGTPAGRGAPPAVVPAAPTFGAAFATMLANSNTSSGSLVGTASTSIRSDAMASSASRADTTVGTTLATQSTSCSALIG